MDHFPKSTLFVFCKLKKLSDDMYLIFIQCLTYLGKWLALLWGREGGGAGTFKRLTPVLFASDEDAAFMLILMKSIFIIKDFFELF